MTCCVCIKQTKSYDITQTSKRLPYPCSFFLANVYLSFKESTSYMHVIVNMSRMKPMFLLSLSKPIRFDYLGFLLLIRQWLCMVMLISPSLSLSPLRNVMVQMMVTLKTKYIMCKKGPLCYFYKSFFFPFKSSYFYKHLLLFLNLNLNLSTLECVSWTRILQQDQFSVLVRIKKE